MKIVDHLKSEIRDGTSRETHPSDALRTIKEFEPEGIDAVEYCNQEEYVSEEEWIYGPMDV